MTGPRAALRDLRYAAPLYLERVASGPGAAAAARRCRRLARDGLAATIGYFQSSRAGPDEIVASHRAVAALLADRRADVCLAVKAPPLRFDGGLLRGIARAAADSGLPLMFDAHAARDAEPTLAAVEALLADFPGTGFALPARWRRSLGDASAFRDGSARIRIVKGEWADPDGDEADVAANYVRVAESLAGRAGPVAVATHDPDLAERALTLLLAAGTPCELEQLRGLPSRRTMAVARRLDVPVRVYVPFGPGWWPYALDKALERPYLPAWMIRDRLGRADFPLSRPSREREGEGL